MKISVKQLNKAMDYFKYSANLDETTEIEVRVREENFDEGKIMGCITLSAEVVKKPREYDRVKTEKLVTISMEIFPHHENRPARITLQESQDLGED